MRLLWGIVLVVCSGLGCGKDGKLDPNMFTPAPPPPPRVEGVNAMFDTGFRSHDLQLTHKHPWGDLEDVEVTVTFYREDGSTQEVKKFWGSWKPKEAKKINIPAHRYQRVDVTGSAIALAKVSHKGADGKPQEGLAGTKHSINESWTGTGVGSDLSYISAAFASQSSAARVARRAVNPVT